MKLPYVCIPMLLAVCFLFLKCCDCSRPSPEEPRTAAVPHPVVRDDDEPRFQFQHHNDSADEEITATRPGAVVEVQGAEGRMAGAAPSASATASDKKDDDQGGVVDVMIWWWSKHQTTSLMRSSVLLRSRLLARRVLLAGAPPVEGAAAGSACHSSDVHIGCGSPPRD
ncbi:hypothetical protein BS78_01G104800 [Paspalum vaginatum]|nr:hypothetical protein BS78_01G104800 [Paspalum vaginatum]